MREITSYLEQAAPVKRIRDSEFWNIAIWFLYAVFRELKDEASFTAMVDELKSSRESSEVLLFCSFLLAHLGIDSMWYPELLPNTVSIDTPTSLLPKGLWASCTQTLWIWALYWNIVFMKYCFIDWFMYINISCLIENKKVIHIDIMFTKCTIHRCLGDLFIPKRRGIHVAVECKCKDFGQKNSAIGP